MKLSWRPGTMLYPLPAVIVSCGNSIENSNLITIAWTGTVCSDPAMLYISVRHERASYDILRNNMEFTVNLTTEAIAKATDWCGVRSGREYNKWKETGLTPLPGEKVSCPYIEESPVSIECRVREIISLGSHDMFLAEVLNVIVDDRFIDKETGALDLASSGLITYCHGAYFTLGDYIGHFGYSVKKNKNKAEKRR